MRLRPDFGEIRGDAELVSKRRLFETGGTSEASESIGEGRGGLDRIWPAGRPKRALNASITRPHGWFRGIGNAHSRAVAILDPVERTSEVLFGLIMVLTFTSSISVAESGRAEMREVLVGAVGCNLAWGIVDAAMYLMASLTERARGLATLRALRRTNEPEAAHRLIRDALPSVVAAELTLTEVESLRQRLNQRAEPPAAVRLNARDFAGATGVFLLVFLSTFPVVIPFIVMREVGPAMRTSNLTAALLLFAAGWRLGTYTGRAAWRTGLETVAVAIVLVAITMALGG